MTQIELRAVEIMCSNLPKIAKELERANKLKALELKGKAGRDLNLSAEDVNAIMGTQN